MNDNPDSWREFPGDGGDGDPRNRIHNPSSSKGQPGIPGAGTPRGGNKPASDDDPEELLFYQYDLPPQGGMTPQGGAPGNVSGPVVPAPGTGGKSKSKEDDFDVTFDFDGEYRDLPDNRPIRPRREKKTGCLGGILYAVFIICVCLLLASLLWLAATDVLGLGKSGQKVQVTVAQGFTIDSISDALYQNGLIKYKFLFKLYADFSHASAKITPGTYELNRSYDYRALVSGLSAHSGKRVEVSVTIPEGFTEKQIFNLLEVNKVCSAADLWSTATTYDFKYDFLDKASLGNKKRLEGFLFPDTYTFYVGDSPTRAITKMLDNFKAKLTAEYIARAKELGYSVRDIVTIAAMIEKEAGADAERSTISSVIYNRLKSKSLPYLQIDATIFYAIADTGQKFSTDVDSPYNTYKVKGLPAGPIASPGIASIKAALYPQSTNYYYYALNKSGTHNFFNDATAFNAFVKSDKYGG